MAKTNVVVLRGGPSEEYETSLRSGRHIIDVLNTDKYNVMDVLVDRNAKWFYRGLQIEEYEILSKADVVFNALHGSYGEDGRVQTLLENSGIPFTGPKSFGAALSFHKVFALEELKKHKIDGLLFQGQKLVTALDLLDGNLQNVVDEIFNSFPPPYVVKPVKGGSSFGVSMVNTKDELLNVLEKTVAEFNEVVVEEYIMGKEITIGLGEEMRGESLYVAPPLEILKTEKKIFDTGMKYMEGIEETFKMPASLPQDVSEELPDISRAIYGILKGRHYGRIDMIFARGKDLYFLEYNSLPGLTKHSLLPYLWGAVGIDFAGFIEHVITLALEGK